MVSTDAELNGDTRLRHRLRRNCERCAVPKAALNGIELYYESHGEGPAVVFAHGRGYLAQGPMPW